MSMVAGPLTGMIPQPASAISKLTSGNATTMPRKRTVVVPMYLEYREIGYTREGAARVSRRSRKSCEYTASRDYVADWSHTCSEHCVADSMHYRIPERNTAG